MDRQVFKDRLLETENLTDNLEDQDAKILINWGIEQIAPLVNGVHDEDEANEKIYQLMQLMREINSIAGNPSTVSQEKISRLLAAYQKTFNITHSIGEEEAKAALEKIPNMQPGETVKYLLEWMKSQQEK